MLLAALLAIPDGLIPHKNSFTDHTRLLAWYEVACWMACFAWCLNFFVIEALREKMPPVIRVWVRPLILSVMLLVGCSIGRWALNGIVLHWPIYEVQTMAYLIDAHVAIGLASLGCWYVLRKNNNIFERMARHKQNSDRFLAITNSTRITGIIEFDEQRIIWYANPAAVRTFDCPVENLIGEDFANLVEASHRPEIISEVAAFARAGKSDGTSQMFSGSAPLEITGLRWGSYPFTMECSFSGYKTSPQSDWRFVCILRDISYRKDLERRLRINEAPASRATT